MNFHANYELSPPVQLLTDSFASIPIEKVSPQSNDSQSDQVFKSNVYFNDYNYRTWENLNGNNFSTLAEFAPPLKQAGANFTAQFQLPLNNTSWDEEQNYVPFGYGPRYNASYRQPFELENVVVLSDGTCASGMFAFPGEASADRPTACAVFLHLLAQLNIKTIAIGGLPGGKPMQAIGGTKGDNAASAEIIQQDVQALVKLGAISDMNAASALLPGLVPLPLGDIKGTVHKEYGINTRNHLLPNDTVPSMMRFEPADCHVYFTPQNVADVRRMWKDAVDIAWNGKTCAVGGFNANASNSKAGSGTYTSGSVREKVADKMIGLVVILGVAIFEAVFR